MLALKPLDAANSIDRQLSVPASPAILINVFTVAESDADALLTAWETDASWMKRQPGFISTQLHRALGSSTMFLNYAVWESTEHFRLAFTHPEFVSSLAAYPQSTVAMPHLFTRIAVPNLCAA